MVAGCGGVDGELSKRVMEAHLKGMVRRGVTWRQWKFKVKDKCCLTGRAEQAAGPSVNNDDLPSHL